MNKVVKTKPITNNSISTFPTVRDFTIFSGKNQNIVSIHVDWEGLTGTLDATIQILQKNDDLLKWVEISELSVILDTASDSIILENSEWGGETLGLRFTKNNCTGGVLNVVVIAKDK